jgi:DNA primase small subunit
LWYDFLEPEFGFDEKYLQVTFSGHRGFHLHYRSPDIWSLDSQARRELVSHIKGEGVDIQVLLAGPDSSWKRRITSGVDSVLTKLDLAVNDDAQGRKSAKELKGIIDSRIGTPGCKVPSCGIKSILAIAEKVQETGRRGRLTNGFETGGLKPVFGGRLDNIFLELVKGDKSVVLGNAGETDEVVTIDLKRVIRWPTSLHGKSGMKVVEFPLERLDPHGSNPFDPLTEAVPWKMGGEKIPLRGIKSDVTYRIGTTEGELNEGDECSVDEATATFLVLKQWAEPVA